MNLGSRSSAERFRWIWLVGFVIVVRTVYVLVCTQLCDFAIDEDYYDELARNLAHGWGYVIEPGGTPTLFRYPGYPYFLSVLFRLSNEPYVLLVCVQLLLDLTTLGLIFAIAKDIFSRPTSVLAVVVSAMYPFSAVYVARYMTEPLFGFLLAAAMLFLTRGLRQGGFWRFALTGIALGLAVLCRASLFYFLLLLPLLALFVSARDLRRTNFRASIVACIIAISLMIPWGLRNLATTGEFDLLGTAGGYSLWLGNYPLFDGRDRDELPEPLEQMFLDEERRIAVDGNPFSPESERHFIRVTLEVWMEQPLDSVWLIFRKGFRFWFSLYKPENRVYAIALIPIQIGLLFLALAGVARASRDGLMHWHLVILILYLNALHAVVTATFRYSIPVMPYVIMFSSYAALPYVSRWRYRRIFR